MSKSKNKALAIVLVLAIVAGAVAAFIAFRRGAEPAAPESPVENRSDDRYAAGLDKIRDAQQIAVKAIGAARRELAAAEAANASAEELTRLTNAVLAAYEDFEKCRVAAEKVVRDRMNSRSDNQK